MSDRIDILVIAPKNLCDVVLGCFGSDTGIRAVGRYSAESGIGCLHLHPPDMVFLALCWLNLIKGPIRGRYHNMPIAVVGDGTMAEEISRLDLSDKNVRRNLRDPSHPLNPLLQPGVDFVSLAQLIQNSSRIIEQIKLRHDPLHRFGVSYSALHWQSYWEQIEGDVYINETAMRSFINTLIGLNLGNYLPVLVNISGGPGSGKTYWERLIRNYIHTECEEVISSGMAGRDIAEVYKEIKYFLIPTLSTTRSPRQDETLSNREWLGRLEPESDFLFTVTRHENGLSYNNGLRLSVMEQCLREYLTINQILQKGGKLSGFLPIMTFFRFPVPQRLRWETMHRNWAERIFLSLYLTTPGYENPDVPTRIHIERIKRRESMDKKIQWRIATIEAENCRLTMETSPPLYFFDGLIVLEKDDTEFNFFEKLFRCLRPKGNRSLLI